MVLKCCSSMNVSNTVHSHQLRDEAENGSAFNTSDACLVEEVLAMS